MTINIPRSSTPRVSIIIPASSRLGLLLACLGSIARFGPASLPYETIVVLDQADEATKAELKKAVTGIEVLASRVNIGLAAAGNYGRSVARGEFLVLLHDDAEIEPGWLEALVQAADDYPEAGAVGSKVLYPDGRLQAVGMIIWRDGSTSPPWVGEVPPASAFPDLRPVDQLGSCSILVRANAWNAVGGLDETFFPVYYVDVDLSMALHQLGLFALYQPASCVRHHQGASNPARFRSFLIGRNRLVFVEKWGSALSEFAPPARDSQDAVDQALARAKAFAERCRQRGPLAIQPRPPQPIDPLAKESHYLEKGLKVQREYIDYLNQTLDETLADRDRRQARCLAAEQELTEASAARDREFAELLAARDRELAEFRTCIAATEAIQRDGWGIYRRFEPLLRRLRRPPLT